MGDDCIGLPHAGAGVRARANLLFSLSAVTATVLAGCELWMMHAAPAAFGMALRWLHVPIWVNMGVDGRIRAAPSTSWAVMVLAWSVCSVRTLSLMLNFVFTPNLNYREITSLRHVSFLVKRSLSPNPWMPIAQLSPAFVRDLPRGCYNWRRGEGARRRW
jgi:hypothetical protein